MRERGAATLDKVRVSSFPLDPKIHFFKCTLTKKLLYAAVGIHLGISPRKIWPKNYINIKACIKNATTFKH